MNHAIWLAIGVPAFWLVHIFSKSDAKGTDSLIRCQDCGWQGRRGQLETILRLCPQCDGDRFEEVEGL